MFAIVRRQGFHGDDAGLLRGLRESGCAELRSGPVRVEVFAPVLPYHRTLPERAVVVEQLEARRARVLAHGLVRALVPSRGEEANQRSAPA